MQTFDPKPAGQARPAAGFVAQAGHRCKAVAPRQHPAPPTRHPEGSLQATLGLLRGSRSLVCCFSQPGLHPSVTSHFRPSHAPWRDLHTAGEFAPRHQTIDGGFTQPNDAQHIGQADQAIPLHGLGLRGVDKVQRRGPTWAALRGFQRSPPGVALVQGGCVALTCPLGNTSAQFPKVSRAGPGG